MDSSKVLNFYDLKSAKEASMPDNFTHVFIIANERAKADGKIGRKYTVFPNFNYFLKFRHQYPHCHELMVDHVNNEKDPSGRLVFDFDIKYSDTKKEDIPKNINRQIEKMIIYVTEKYFKNTISYEYFEFVWSHTKNDEKLSKHLTVKNMYFDDWIKMTHIFYRLFSHEWDKKYDWITSESLIDAGVARTNGSLRMVGSSKIGKHVLKLEDDRYTLSDSLIRIYDPKVAADEQLVEYSDLNDKAIDFLNQLDSQQFAKLAKPTKAIIPSSHSVETSELKYEELVYQTAFKLYQSIFKGYAIYDAERQVFHMTKMQNRSVHLGRLKSNYCLITGKFHESENAFLYISHADEYYKVYFGCFRELKDNKYIKIPIGRFHESHFNLITENSVHKKIRAMITLANIYRDKNDQISTERISKKDYDRIMSLINNN